jgi:hypothetical protein
MIILMLQGHSSILTVGSQDYRSLEENQATTCAVRLYSLFYFVCLLFQDIRQIFPTVFLLLITLVFAVTVVPYVFLTVIKQLQASMELEDQRDKIKYYTQTYYLLY